jgi:molecular chaperone DnaJ
MDYYITLGVERTATLDEIKKAYRKLAMQYHPDRNPGDKDAETKFKTVQEAYDTLSNPEKKSRYDAFGTVGPRYTAPPRPQPPQPKPKTKEDFERERKQEKSKKEKAASPLDEDLAKIDCTFFNGNGTGRNIMVQLKLTAAEMKSGGVKSVTIKKRDLCKRCVGDGKAMVSCPACGGRRDEVGHCMKCHGYGAEDRVCPSCNGEGVKDWIMQEVKVVFSRNIQPGHQVNILGEGEAAPRRPPGNLRVVVVTK